MPRLPSARGPNSEESWSDGICTELNVSRSSLSQICFPFAEIAHCREYKRCSGRDNRRHLHILTETQD